MSEPICRWGILGAADIARKNWQAIRNAPNCSLTAVASRDPRKCRQFVAQCQSHVPFSPPPRACGSYEELLSLDGVDAVYLPLPTVVRKQWAIRAAEAGKHVLAVHEYSNSNENSQETNMFRHFARLSLSGKLDPYWGEIALKTQQVLDACLQSACSAGRTVAV